MHRRYLAYLYVNDYYEPGFEFINIDTTKKADIRKIRKVKLLIKLRDLLCRLNLISPGILCAILFKEDPSSVLIDSLKSSGWQVKKLPRNPYL
jgi:hypothetical protein